MKKGNTVIAALVIAALLVGALMLMMRERTPIGIDQITPAMENFQRLVFDQSDELIVAYAQNGYTRNDNLWMCKGTPTPPVISTVTSEFTPFAQTKLEQKLQVLLATDQTVNMAMTPADIELIGGSFNSLPNLTVNVTVQDFNVTVFGVDTNVTYQFGGNDTYNFQFWRMYKVLSDWTYCADKNIYEPLQIPASTHICSFFKDLCPAPPTTEVCTSSDGKMMQDFTANDRALMSQRYGISSTDLRVAAQRSMESLNGYFNGTSSCVQPRLGLDSGIRCTAALSKHNIHNDFWTTYAKLGCTDRRQMTTKTFCAVIPYNQTSNISCQQLIDRASQGYPVSAAELARICAGIATPGKTGLWSEALQNSATCAPASPEAGIPQYGDTYYDSLVQTFSQKGPQVKCMKQDADVNRIIGAIGYMDTTGEYELTVSCTDPGSLQTSPMTATVRMNIAFRHVCDTNLRTLYDTLPCPSPPGTRQTIAVSVCDGVVCPKSGICEPENECVSIMGKAECQPKGESPTSCAPVGGGNACKEYLCINKECVESPATGGSCGGGCGVCSNGDCVASTDNRPCMPPDGSFCKKYQCNGFSCEQIGNNDGAVCAEVGECTKKCSGGTCGNFKGGTCSNECPTCDGVGSVSGRCVDAGEFSITCDVPQCPLPQCCGSGPACGAGYCCDAASSSCFVEGTCGGAG